jgi:hypothetical protein
VPPGEPGPATVPRLNVNAGSGNPGTTDALGQCERAMPPSRVLAANVTQGARDTDFLPCLERRDALLLCAPLGQVPDLTRIPSC